MYKYDTFFSQINSGEKQRIVMSLALWSVMQVALGMKPATHMRFRPFSFTLAVVLNVSISVSFVQFYHLQSRDQSPSRTFVSHLSFNVPDHCQEQPVVVPGC
jgi:hypothetical protein